MSNLSEDDMTFEAAETTDSKFIFMLKLQKSADPKGGVECVAGIHQGLTIAAQLAVIDTARQLLNKFESNLRGGIGSKGKFTKA